MKSMIEVFDDYVCNIAAYQIRANKLIKLANDFEKAKKRHLQRVWSLRDDGTLTFYNGLGYMFGWQAEACLINKGYGFVEWLCKKKKINYRKLNIKEMDFIKRGVGVSLSDKVTIMLSVSERPLYCLVNLL